MSAQKYLILDPSFIVKPDNLEKFGKIEDFLDEVDVGKRILYVMPNSAKDVFVSTSLFKSIKEKYPKYNLYVATKPENFSILWANEFIHKVIPYSQSFDNVLSLEGLGESKEYFNIVLAPYLTTQRHSNYILSSIIYNQLLTLLHYKMQNCLQANLHT